MAGEWQGPLDDGEASRLRGWGPFLVGIGAIIFVAMIEQSGDGGGSSSASSSSASSSSASSSSDSRPPAGEDYTTEEQLALLIDDSTDDAVVRRYRIALNAAEPVCIQSRQGIGDIAYRGTRVAEDQGVDISALEVLQALPEAVPRESRPTDCGDVVAALIVLLTP